MRENLLIFFFFFSSKFLFLFDAFEFFDFFHLIFFTRETLNSREFVCFCVHS